MVIDIKDYIIMDILMAMVNIIGKMGLNIKVILSEGWDKGKEFGSILKVMFIKVNIVLFIG